ncbi:MAG: ADP-ribosylglycohydrolase family protein [Enterobacter sp.]
MNTEDKIIGILLSGCIGDILGSTNEGKKFNEIRSQEIIRDFKINKFTDDTELTLILAEYLIRYYNGQNSNHSMVEKLHEMYQKTVSKSKRGYSSRTRQILSEWHLCMIGGDADTNGCVMRIAPLAVVDFSAKLSDEQLKKIIKYTVYCTHGESNDALDICFLHVKAISSLLKSRNNNALEMYNYILHYCKKIGNINFYPLLLLINPFNKYVLFKNGKPSLNDNITKTIFGIEIFQIKAIQCYICALICFLYNFENPIDAFIMAANIGGDTDTICKLVGDLVGAKYGTKWIPLPWSEPEQHVYIKNLGKSLTNKFKSSQ